MLFISSSHKHGQVMVMVISDMEQRKHSIKTIVGRPVKIEAYVYIASKHHRLPAQRPHRHALRHVPPSGSHCSAHAATHAKGCVLLFHQQRTQPAQGRLVRRHRAVPLLQTAGKRHLHLASAGLRQRGEMDADHPIGSEPSAGWNRAETMHEKSVV